MRNSHVVLVLLYIGLASGFIDPSGAAENGEKTDSTPRSTSVAVVGASPQEKMKSSCNKPYTLNLENRKNSLNEDELFEQATEKQSNVNERSFIYINQKFRTPILMRYNLQDLKNKRHKTLFSDMDTLDFNKLLQRSSVHPEEFSKRGRFNSNREGISQYFPTFQYQKFHGNTNEGNVNRHINEVNEVIRDYNNKTNLIIDDRRQYLELLKVPITRNNIKNNTGVTKSIINNNTRTTTRVVPGKLFPPYYSITNNILPQTDSTNDKESSDVVKNYRIPNKYDNYQVVTYRNKMHKDHDKLNDEVVAESNSKYSNYFDDDDLLYAYLKESKY